jgi:DNA-binding transcriptional LysR family regulator
MLARLIDYCEFRDNLAMDRLLAIQAFAKVVELGSFARAAERLSVSTSAVSRQVAELEAHLDARLLNRTTRRLSLTETGQTFYEHSVQLLAALDDAEASVSTTTQKPKGTLRLTCGVTFGERYLAPAIADFCALHPELVFDLDLSDRMVDLVEEGFDLALRIGPARQQGVVSRRIGETQLVCCAAPAYLENHPGPLLEPDDLAQHECLSYSQTVLPNVWEFGSGNSRDKIAVRIPLRHRANNGRMLVAMAVEGLGILFEPDFIVAPEIRSGLLTPLLKDYRPPTAPIAAVYPSRRHLSAKVRSFVDFLAERFKRRQEWSLTDPA